MTFIDYYLPNNLVRFYSLIALIVLCLSLASCSPPLNKVTLNNNKYETNLNVEIRLNAIGNLFYQLECLTEQISCSRDVYKSHWNELGLNSSIDHTMLMNFKSALKKYAVSANLRTPDLEPTCTTYTFGPEIVAIGPRSNHLSIKNKLRHAAYNSSTISELNHHLEMLMNYADVGTVTSAIKYFEPRFREWWDSEAYGPSLAFKIELNNLINNEFRSSLPSIGKFFEFNINDTNSKILIDIIVYPLKNQGTRAQLVDNHAVIETPIGELPEQRLGVLIHEICHYFFRIASAEFHDYRLRGALDVNDSRATATLGLMNEALATAVGNGYIE